jgi:type IV pilus assembly protein PilZ
MADQEDPNKSKVATPVTATTTPAAPATPVISLAIKDPKVLYASYMPFVEKGGLFIPSRKQFSIGDSLSLVISLLSEDKKFPVDGKVVWITPAKANNMAPGVGVQFNGASAAELAAKIEQALVVFSTSGERTNTM